MRGTQAVAASPTFQRNTIPRVDPIMTVAMLWTMAPRVIPTRPLTFCGSVLSLAVTAPVYRI